MARAALLPVLVPGNLVSCLDALLALWQSGGRWGRFRLGCGFCAESTGHVDDSGLAMVIQAIASLAVFASASAVGEAPDEQSPPAETSSSLELNLQGAFAHQLDTDLDGGASFSVNRLFVQPGLDWGIDERLSVSFAIGYSYDDYRFSSAGGPGLADPWDGIHTLRLSAFVRWVPEDRWTVFVAPSLRLAAESGADFGDSVYGGGFAGFAYRVNERLTIGPGFGALTQIEDDVSVFPVLIIDWKITDDLTLRTGRGLGATQGPGLVVAWSFAEHWELLLGGRYESQRFRLSESGPVPDGVGEETSFPIYGGITWSPKPGLELSVLGGVSFAGRLRLDSPTGVRIASEDYDPAGFVGVVFTCRF